MYTAPFHAAAVLFLALCAVDTEGARARHGGGVRGGAHLASTHGVVDGLPRRARVPANEPVHFGENGGPDQPAKVVCSLF